MSTPLDASVLAELRQIDSCTVANAIETFGVRLRNTGFTDSTVGCMFEDFPPLVGYAATVRVRTSEPPMEGENYYYRLDWLDHVLGIPEPRIVVVEDLDSQPGLGALIGEVHAHILSAIGCIGVATNGAVRDLEGARAIKFQMFARNVSVSHAFAHVVDFGGPVRVGKMQARPGDLLHGDRHGLQSVPLEIAAQIAGVAQRLTDEERALFALCRSRDFTVEKLRAEVEALRQKRRNSSKD